LNLKQLEAFYLVVKKKGFTRAAEDLNVTQPAVTIQVKSLEKSLNVNLIQKVGKRLQHYNLCKGISLHHLEYNPIRISKIDNPYTS
jgi:Mn-dependent DtxR family transcriptional regulator